MKEHDKAKAWRERRDLRIWELAELTGYSPLAIRYFEKGVTPPRSNVESGRISKTTWQRFKNCCAGIEARLRTKKEFDW